MLRMFRKHGIFWFRFWVFGNRRFGARFRTRFWSLNHWLIAETKRSVYYIFASAVIFAPSFTPSMTLTLTFADTFAFAPTLRRISLLLDVFFTLFTKLGVLGRFRLQNSGHLAFTCRIIFHSEWRNSLFGLSYRVVVNYTKLAFLRWTRFAWFAFTSMLTTLKVLKFFIKIPHQFLL